MIDYNAARTKTRATEEPYPDPRPTEGTGGWQALYVLRIYSDGRVLAPLQDELDRNP